MDGIFLLNLSCLVKCLKVPFVVNWFCTNKLSRIQFIQCNELEV